MYEVAVSSGIFYLAYNIVILKDELETCKAPVAYYFAAVLSEFGLIVLCNYFRRTKILKYIVPTIFSTLLMLLAATLPIGLLFSLINEIYSKDCIANRSIKIFNLILTAILNLCLGLAIILILVKNLRKKIAKRKTQPVFEVEIKNIYKKIHKESLDIEQFINNYFDVIDEVPFNQFELAILRDCCTTESANDYSQLDESLQKTCVICLTAYEKKSEIFIHPECNHNFHLSCMLNWLEQKLYCPCCKLGTRTELLKHIKYKKVAVFDSRDVEEITIRGEYFKEKEIRVDFETTIEHLSRSSYTDIKIKEKILGCESLLSSTTDVPK